MVGTEGSAPPEIRKWRYHFTTGVIKGEVYNYPGHEDAAPISTSQVARKFTSNDDVARAFWVGF